MVIYMQTQWERERTYSIINLLFFVKLEKRYSWKTQPDLKWEIFSYQTCNPNSTWYNQKNMHSWCLKIFAGIHWNYNISWISTFAVLSAAPYPVEIPQPRRQTFSSGALSSTWNASYVTVFLNKETTVKWRQFLNNTKTIKSKQWVYKVQVHAVSQLEGYIILSKKKCSDTHKVSKLL